MNGMKVRKKRPRGVKKRPRGFKWAPRTPCLLLPARRLHHVGREPIVVDAADAPQLLRVPRLGLYPIVTSQYSSTTLYQVSYHFQSLFL